tara:strand:+ start:2796 stop:3674 length:879 start_codon:yes stop_codon:yes gene_type:complete
MALRVTVDKFQLEQLLKRTQRLQNINGKSIAQVHSCVLNIVADTFNLPTIMSTTSLVKDGLTSVSYFDIPCTILGGPTKDTSIPVSDINMLLGVLKYHGQNLTISYEIKVSNSVPNKVVIKSSNKTTTIQSSMDSLAFPHSNVTLGTWNDKSLALKEKINPITGNYKLSTGGYQSPSHQWTFDSTDLFEALRCDNMNNQKLNEFTLSWNANHLWVITGKELKGQTETELFKSDSPISQEPVYNCKFQGGLDNVAQLMDTEITLSILDFTKQKQGYKLIISSEEGFVFQSGVL